MLLFFIGLVNQSFERKNLLSKKASHFGALKQIILNFPLSFCLVIVIFMLWLCQVLLFIAISFAHFPIWASLLLKVLKNHHSCHYNCY